MEAFLDFALIFFVDDSHEFCFVVLEFRKDFGLALLIRRGQGVSLLELSCRIAVYATAFWRLAETNRSWA